MPLLLEQPVYFTRWSIKAAVAGLNVITGKSGDDEDALRKSQRVATSGERIGVDIYFGHLYNTDGIR